MPQKRGKLIVIDGLDGSGKATQTKLLLAKLKKEGYKTAVTDFPQYYTAFFGKMVGRYLSGEFGKINQVSPYLASVLYALDRFEAKEKMEEDGSITVAQVRDMFQTSRKYALALMEHLDAIGVTKREGDQRVLAS